MIGSLYVNGNGDAQLVISDDECLDDEIRLTVLNHDDGESAHVVVSKQELLERIQEVCE